MRDKRAEAEEVFGILYNTINGADFDDLHEAVYKLIDVAGYRKRDTESGVQVIFDYPRVYITIGKTAYVTSIGQFETIIKQVFSPVDIVLSEVK